MLNLFRISCLEIRNSKFVLWIPFLLSGIVLTLSPVTLPAQAPLGQSLPGRANASGVYEPLNQRTPPGIAGDWAGILRRADAVYLQPVRVELPTKGRVAVYRTPQQPVELDAPAQVGVAVGHTYRLRLSRMPEFPGVELYPSLEVLDRLHPPTGKVQEVPVPVPVTQQEIEQALAGRLVTKVVYLEQPQLAGLRGHDKAFSVLTVPARSNLLAEADRRGRPMLILRLGGRLPPVHSPLAERGIPGEAGPAFFGRGAPVSVPSLPMEGHRTAPDQPATFSPADPREPVTQVAAYQLPSMTHAGPKLKSSDPPADEYLFDGGDRTPPVHYDDFFRHGLDTEDTVAEYDDRTGNHHVQPSNRVAIYAPGFAAVRAADGPATGVSFDRLASAADHVHGSGLRNRISTTHHAQRESPGGIRVRSRASGLETDDLQAGLRQATVLAEHTKLLNVYQDLTFVRSGLLRQRDAARLAEGIQAAFAWTQDQHPVISASVNEVQETYASSKPQELIGRKDERRSKGRLRVVKLADKKSAAPGEIVTFTIRYDNLGDREVYHVRVVDNLTARLEYIKGSATVEPVVEDNGEGGSLLIFERADPLPGHEGGVITFQAKVR